MPRALSRDEQLVHNYVRRQGVSLPMPVLVEALGLSEDATSTAAAYLVERGLLAVTVYAVGPRRATVPPAVLAG